MIPTASRTRRREANVLSSVVRDVRYAIRQLWHSPGFSAVSIATIALAIGANVAMFSFVNGLLLRPLPYPDADRIVRVLERLPSGGVNGISTLNYLDLASQNNAFEHITAEVAWRPTLTGGSEPLSISGARVSSHYFDIFSAKPALGRTFLPDEDQSGHDRAVVLSHALWQSRFGSDPGVVGRSILLNGESYGVVGVLERGPFDRGGAQLWVPLVFERSNTTRDFRWIRAFAKLKPGMTLEQARAEMDIVGQRLAAAYPGSNKGWGVAVDRLADVLVGPALRTAVTVLFAATVFVLLIGCANLANLGLARSLSRRSEMALRAALGASRWRLMRQLLIEHLVIAACAGVVGVAIGYGILAWIQTLLPFELLPAEADVRIDGPVLLFTFVVAVTTGLLFGVAPAVQITTPNVTGALKAGGHGTIAGSPGRRLRASLIVAEIALAFVLLVGSGLLMRSLLKLLNVDPGFTATNVLTASLPISSERYPGPAALNTYLASIRAAIDAVPGVRETAFASALPLQGWGFGVPYTVAGRGVTNTINRRPAFFKVVSPSYFDALEIKLRSGRLLSDGDGAGAPPVVLINDTLARREFADQNPIGQRLLVREIIPGRAEFGPEIAWEIVGVIAGEKITRLSDEIDAGMYVSNAQSPPFNVELVVRAGVSPQSLQRAVRSAVDRVNRDQPLSNVRPLERIVSDSILGNRVTSIVFAAFAGMALLLAALGIYGVMSYTVSQRTHEMGIRAALGATPRSLRMLIVVGGVQLAVTGILAGLAAMVPATDILSSILYGVRTFDTLTIASVAALLLAVAGLACFLPARRITRADPLESLRIY